MVKLVCTGWGCREFVVTCSVTLQLQCMWPGLGCQVAWTVRGITLVPGRLALEVIARMLEVCKDMASKHTHMLPWHAGPAASLSKHCCRTWTWPNM